MEMYIKEMATGLYVGLALDASVSGVYRQYRLVSTRTKDGPLRVPELVLAGRPSKVPDIDDSETPLETLDPNYEGDNPLEGARKATIRAKLNIRRDTQALVVEAGKLVVEADGGKLKVAVGNSLTMESELELDAYVDADLLVEIDLDTGGRLWFYDRLVAATSETASPGETLSDPESNVVRTGLWYVDIWDRVFLGEPPENPKAEDVTITPGPDPRFEIQVQFNGDLFASSGEGRSLQLGVLWNDVEDVESARGEAVAPNANSHVIRGLAPSTQVYTWVILSNLEGFFSQAVATGSLTTVESVAPVGLELVDVALDPIDPRTGLLFSNLGAINDADSEVVTITISVENGPSKTIDYGPDTATLDGLEPDTLYRALVSATDSFGNASEPVFIREIQTGETNPPALEGATLALWPGDPRRGVRVLLESTDDTGVAQETVFWSTENDLDSSQSVETGLEPATDVTGLEPDTEYWFWAKIRDVFLNETGPLPIGSIRTGETNPPTGLENVTVEPGSDVSSQASFKNLDQIVDDTALESVTLFYGTNPTLANALAITRPANQLQSVVTVSGLEPTTRYHFWVKARDVYGNEAGPIQTQPDSFETGEINPPTGLSLVKAEPDPVDIGTRIRVFDLQEIVDDTQVARKWVRWSTSNNASGAAQTEIPIDVDQYVITGRTPLTRYFIWVVARDVFGNTSGPTPIADGGFVDLLESNPPTGLGGVTVSRDPQEPRFRLRFDGLEGIQDDTLLVSVQVLVSVTGQIEDAVRADVAPGTNSRLFGVESDTTYACWVEATDQYGNQARVTLGSVTTAESDPPTGLGSVSVAADAEDPRFRIRFANLTSVQDASNIVELRVRWSLQNNVSTGQTAAIASEDRSNGFFVVDVQPQSTYYAWVSAVDEYDNAIGPVFVGTADTVEANAPTGLAGVTVAPHPTDPTKIRFEGLAGIQDDTALAYKRLRWSTTNNPATGQTHDLATQDDRYDASVSSLARHFCWVTASDTYGTIAGPVYVGAVEPSEGVPPTGLENVDFGPDPDEPRYRLLVTGLGGISDTNGIQSIDILYGTSANKSSATRIANVTGTSKTIAGLAPSTAYHAWIEAVDVFDNRAERFLGVQTTAEGNPPSGLESVTLERDPANPRFAIRFANLANVTDQSGIVALAVWYGLGDSIGSATRVAVSPGQNARTISGLVPDKTYRGWVEATDSLGNSATVKVGNATTAEANPPDLSSVAVELSSTTSFVFVGLADIADESNLVEIKVMWRQVGSSNRQSVSVPIGQANREIANLPVGATYECWVYARDQWGNETEVSIGSVRLSTPYVVKRYAFRVRHPTDHTVIWRLDETVGRAGFLTLEVEAEPASDLTDFDYKLAFQGVELDDSGTNRRTRKEIASWNRGERSGRMVIEGSFKDVDLDITATVVLLTSEYKQYEYNWRLTGNNGSASLALVNVAGLETFASADVRASLLSGRNDYEWRLKLADIELVQGNTTAPSDKADITRLAPNAFDQLVVEAETKDVLMDAKMIVTPLADDDLPYSKHVTSWTVGHNETRGTWELQSVNGRAGYLILDVQSSLPAGFNDYYYKFEFGGVTLELTASSAQTKREIGYWGPGELDGLAVVVGEFNDAILQVTATLVVLEYTRYEYIWKIEDGPEGNQTFEMLELDERPGYLEVDIYTELKGGRDDFEWTFSILDVELGAGNRVTPIDRAEVTRWGPGERSGKLEATGDFKDAQGTVRITVTLLGNEPVPTPENLPDPPGNFGAVTLAPAGKTELRFGNLNAIEGAIVDIRAYLSSSNAFANATEYSVPLGQNTFDVGSLQEDTRYWAWLWARDSDGTSAGAAFIGNAKTLEATPPNLSGVRVGVTADDALLFSGLDSVTDPSGVESLEILWATNTNIGSAASRSVAPGTEFEKVEGITPGTTYYAWVRARDALDNQATAYVGTAIVEVPYEIHDYVWNVSAGSQQSISWALQAPNGREGILIVDVDSDRFPGRSDYDYKLDFGGVSMEVENGTNAISQEEIGTWLPGTYSGGISITGFAKDASMTVRARLILLRVVYTQYNYQWNITGNRNEDWTLVNVNNRSGYASIDVVSSLRRGRNDYEWQAQLADISLQQPETDKDVDKQEITRWINGTYAGRLKLEINFPDADAVLNSIITPVTDDSIPYRIYDYEWTVGANETNRTFTLANVDNRAGYLTLEVTSSKPSNRSDYEYDLQFAGVRLDVKNASQTLSRREIGYWDPGELKGPATIVGTFNDAIMTIRARLFLIRYTQYRYVWRIDDPDSGDLRGDRGWQLFDVAGRQGFLDVTVDLQTKPGRGDHEWSLSVLDIDMSEGSRDSPSFREQVTRFGVGEINGAIPVQSEFKDASGVVTMTLTLLD